MLRNPNYVYGPTNLQVPARLNFGEYLIDNISKYIDRTAYIDASTHEKISYLEILQNAMNLAVSLTKLVVRKGDVIAVFSEERREFWPCVIGSICAGATITLINITYTEVELQHILNISKPKYLFVSPQCFDVHKTLIRSQEFIDKIFLFGNEWPSLYENLVTKDVKREDFLAVDVDGQSDIMAITYSSGTTGLPKGVMVTHYNAIVSCVTTVTRNRSYDETMEMSMLTLIPWHQTFGLWGNIVSMASGRLRIFMRSFEEKQFLETVEKYKPSVLIAVPHILVKLAKSQIIEHYDVSSLTRIYSSAAVLHLDTIDDVTKRFPNLTEVVQGYGMTESTMAISVSDKCPVAKKGSVGTAVFGVIVKVVDPTTRKALGPNQPGEICVKGSIIMKGYIGRDISENFDEEGFFKTGDLGYYDDDKYFYLVDRIKELIKYRGRHVPPAEIEAQLLRHPAVLEVGVVGLKDKESGELPLAFIVKKTGYHVTEEELKSFVALKLSDPKHLRGGVRFVNEIPRNNNGKLLRRILRSMAEPIRQ